MTETVDRSRSTTAADLMTTSVATARADWTLADLERAFVERKVSGFPVVEDDRLLGVVSRSDVIRRVAVERSRAESVSAYYREYDAWDDPHPVTERLAEEQAIAERMIDVRVGDLMSKPALALEADTPIDKAAHFLLEHRIHRVPVVRHDRLVGLLSSSDLLRLVAEGGVSNAGRDE